MFKEDFKKFCKDTNLPHQFIVKKLIVKKAVWVVGWLFFGRRVLMLGSLNLQITIFWQRLLNRMGLNG